MYWQWFFELSGKPFRPLSTYLRRHPGGAFRGLLFGGIVLILAVLLFLQHVFQHAWGYYAWLAGFAATLGMLFIFTILSVQVNGYRRYRDSWLGLATGIMFVLSAALAIAALYHP